MFNSQLNSKLLTLAVASIVIMALGSSVSAQVPGTPNLKPKVYLGAGLTAISGANGIKENISAGFTGMLAVGLPLSIGIEPIAKLQYHDLGLASSAKALGLPDQNTKVISYGVDAKLSIAPPLSPAKPYLLAGVGLFNFKQDAVTWTDPSLGSITLPAVDETNTYFNIGVGLDVKIGPTFSFFAEGKYSFGKVNGNSINLLPIVVGFRII